MKHFLHFKIETSKYDKSKIIEEYKTTKKCDWVSKAKNSGVVFANYNKTKIVEEYKTVKKKLKPEIRWVQPRIAVWFLQDIDKDFWEREHIIAMSRLKKDPLPSHKETMEAIKKVFFIKTKTKWKFLKTEYREGYLPRFS